MKFLCFCYYDTNKFAALTQDESGAIGNACQPHDAALRATGKLVAQGSLPAADVEVGPAKQRQARDYRWPLPRHKPAGDRMTAVLKSKRK